MPEPRPDAAPAPAASWSKNPEGLRRLAPALRYSLRGLQAAWRSESAFRQEVVLGTALLLAVPFIAPDGIGGLLMAGSVLLVWITELLNTALENIADAVSTAHHPLLGRAKDCGSAAVLIALLGAGLVWAVVMGPVVSAALWPMLR